MITIQRYVFSLQCCSRRTQIEWKTSPIYVHFRTTSTYVKCSYFSVAAHLVSVQSTILLAFCMTLSSISPLNQTLQETVSMKVCYIESCSWYVVLKAVTVLNCMAFWLTDFCLVADSVITGTALPENNEASADLTTANGRTFTSCSARLSSQLCYRSLDQWSTCFNVIGYWDWLSSN